MVVLVTGAGGQLGQTLKSVAGNYPELQFIFCDSSALDITDKNSCERAFRKYAPDYCINTAAYTAVDKAESEPDRVYLINVIGVQNLAEVCKMHNTVLMHLSTDFVFDGKKTTPYTEEDTPNPTGVYGQTKLEAEKVLAGTWKKHFIIRTSWLYSQFGHNFMKTMLRLAAERDSISVVNDQIGTPTHAVDLAEALLAIIQSRKETYGIYHFSNEGECSWYVFAKEIFRKHDIRIDLKAITTAAYPTSAKRPAYSVLDKSKIKTVFGLKIKNWELGV